MRLLRKGINAISCIFTIDDITDLGYNPNNVLARVSAVTEELQGLTSFAMRVASAHFVPIPIPMGLPLEVQAAWYPKSIELCIIAPLPFEIFDLPSEYDEEIDVTEYDSEEDDIGKVFILDEENECICDSQCDDGDLEDDEDLSQNEYVVAFIFKTLNDISAYVKICASLSLPIRADVYKKDEYWLICKFNDAKLVNTYLYLASEWCGRYENDVLKITHVKEHGKRLIEQDAFKILSNL